MHNSILWWMYTHHTSHVKSVRKSYPTRSLFNPHSPQPQPSPPSPPSSLPFNIQICFSSATISPSFPIHLKHGMGREYHHTTHAWTYRILWMFRHRVRIFISIMSRLINSPRSNSCRLAKNTYIDFVRLREIINIITVFYWLIKMNTLN